MDDVKVVVDNDGSFNGFTVEVGGLLFDYATDFRPNEVYLSRESEGASGWWLPVDAIEALLEWKAKSEENPLANGEYTFVNGRWKADTASKKDAAEFVRLARRLGVPVSDKIARLAGDFNG